MNFILEILRKEANIYENNKKYFIILIDNFYDSAGYDGMQSVA